MPERGTHFLERAEIKGQGWSGYEKKANQKETLTNWIGWRVGLVRIQKESGK